MDTLSTSTDQKVVGSNPAECTIERQAPDLRIPGNYKGFGYLSLCVFDPELSHGCTGIHRVRTHAHTHPLDPSRSSGGSVAAREYHPVVDDLLSQSKITTKKVIKNLQNSPIYHV